MRYVPILVLDQVACKHAVYAGELMRHMASRKQRFSSRLPHTTTRAFCIPRIRSGGECGHVRYSDASGRIQPHTFAAEENLVVQYS